MRWDKFRRSPNTFILCICILGLLAFVVGCQQTTELKRIQQQGKLKVLTLQPAENRPNNESGIQGIENKLVSAFAEQLGLELEVIHVPDVKTLLADLSHAKAHMAAAGLTDTTLRRKMLDFSQAYQHINEQLVYRRGSPKPVSLADIPPNTLHVIAKSSHAETLHKLKTKYPDLTWVNWPEVNIDTLLKAVEEGHISYTIADSNILAIGQQTYPHLLSAFNITSNQPIAWAFPKSGDGSLRRAADQFLHDAQHNGVIQRLIARYYGHINQLNYVDKQYFRRHVKERLPKYRDLFIEASVQTGIDWRLLAAISYQESHWREDATSPTGVRGLMMLTRATAKQLGVKNRVDPRESILGGARYLRIVEQKIPERIHPKDRLWFTLASYNVGFGHLEDARILTQRQGADPDLWLEVKKRLPLLANKKYHTTLKHGYARGNEPVIYVENIRNYYDLIMWYEKNPDALSNDQHMQNPAGR